MRPAKRPEDQTYAAVLLYQGGIAELYRSTFGGELTRIFQGDFRGAELIGRGLILAGARVVVYNVNVAGDALLARDRWIPGKGGPFRDSQHPPYGAELGPCDGPCVAALPPGEQCTECGRFAPLESELDTECEDIGCAVDFADEGGAGSHPRHDEAPPSPLESSPDAAAEWSIDAAMAERAEPEGHTRAEWLARVATFGPKTDAMMRARGFCPSCGRRVYSWVPDLAGWRATGRHGTGCYDLVGCPTATPDELASLQGPDEGSCAGCGHPFHALRCRVPRLGLPCGCFDGPGGEL